MAAPRLRRHPIKPARKQPNWAQALLSEKPIVATNAAIALARLGEGHPEESLTVAVRSTELKVTVRRAAAEALGEVHSAEAQKSIRELISQYGQFTGEARSRYVPELHAELIHALARQPNAESDPRIADGLKSPAPSVKRESLEALAAVPADRAKPLPPLALDLATDGDSQVRIAALKLVVARKHPQAGDKVLRALSDYELPVRLAAIELLGQTSGEEAGARLKHLTTDPGEMIRVAAVKALAMRDDREAVESSIGDKSWRVRQVIAKSLAKHADRRSINLAKQFLSDPSLEVQREAVRAASKWPTNMAGSVLFAAIESPSYQTRKDAATLLADCWPEAAGFPIDAPAPRRAELLHDLQDKWNRQFGNIDQSAIAAQAAPDSVELSAEAAAQVQKQVETLEHGDLAERRQAITALAKQSNKISLPDASLQRVVARVTAEDDPVMWLRAFDLIEHDPREQAALLATAGFTHPAPEVRRRACNYSATYPNPARTELLVASLADDNISVLHAAVQALQQSQPPADIRPVEKLLAHADHSLHLDAAIVLVRWNVDSGRAALERMASDDDPQLRRKTAQAIAKVADPALTPTLIKLLDDQQDIRRAALQSLRSLTGQDSPSDSTSEVRPASYSGSDNTDVRASTLAEQAEKWKEWYRRQNR